MHGCRQTPVDTPPQRDVQWLVGSLRLNIWQSRTGRACNIGADWFHGFVWPVSFDTNRRGRGDKLGIIGKGQVIKDYITCFYYCPFLQVPHSYPTSV